MPGSPPPPLAGVTRIGAPKRAAPLPRPGDIAAAASEAAPAAASRRNVVRRIRSLPGPITTHFDVLVDVPPSGWTFPGKSPFGCEDIPRSIDVELPTKSRTRSLDVRYCPHSPRHQ